MALITLRDICMQFGEKPLLDCVSLTVLPGERICLLGRNGVGKTTLLDILGGRLEPDCGDVLQTQGITVSRLPQDVPKELQGSVFDVICRSMGPLGHRLVEYRHLCDSTGSEKAPAHDREQRITALQQTIDREDGWQLERQVTQMITRMNLPADAKVQTFSAGMKRQVLMASALVVQPDLLLLDEPTNHLDMQAIEWLENMLTKFKGSLVMVTHDRMMIRRLATRIIEIDRGALFSWDCGYSTYLQRSQERLEAEEKENKRFDKRLSEEEKWIRQGIKARRTRNEGRVRALLKLRENRQNRRDRTGKVRMAIDEAERSGKMVAEATNLSFSYGDHTVVDDFSCTIMRGDRIGILGSNGIGKSTLIRLLLGELSPEKGSVRLGTNLDVIYFDQLRGQLDESKTVQENASPTGDFLSVGGRNRHVMGYLKDFLFSPQRARTPVWVLSGGEKNRLLLAKLFSRPSNLMVLDEPTNDLDVETLELLEELLMEYNGTVLLVSHDRTFINNVVTSTFVFDTSGHIEGYAGGYDDWLSQRPEVVPEAPDRRAQKRGRKEKTPVVQKKKKLGYMEKRELDEMPGQIESLEIRQKELFSTMSAPDFYRQTGDRIAAVKKELVQVENDLEEAFARWEDLESQNGS